MSIIAEEIQAGAGLQANLTIAGEPFEAMVFYEDGAVKLGAGWQNKAHHAIELGKMTKELGLELPEFLDWRVELERVDFTYETQKRQIAFLLKTDDGKKILFAARLKDKFYSFRLEPKLQYTLSELPVMGKYMARDVSIELPYIQVSYQSGAGANMRYLAVVTIGGKTLELGKKAEALPAAELDGTALDASMPQTALTPLATNVPASAEKNDKIKWMELKKKIGPCYIRRIGVLFEGSVIKLLLDASITIAILTFDFMELYIGIRLGEGFKPHFGLSGLAVSLSKPPLFLSGGLYVAKPGELYNGEITVKYTKFSFLALGSYGVTGQDKKASLFVYLMLDYAFGGPPCFFITGIAAGFGINRKIHIPDVLHVKEFPFVAAAMGKSGKLKPTTGAAEVLSELSNVIEPCEGVHFLTAGIKFTSFGMVESVVVVNVEFGARFELSLLGISELSLPPKVADPIVYGCLALRAVFCPDDGILQIEGALTNDAYLFDHDCKITGGFAFYSWFKGEYAGDFVLTVGGYHPNFHRGHYPAVDRVGINWNISRNLTLKGESYFALTPNCLMAGGRLDIDYVDGKLKAWCHVFANFLIEWKPFHYDIEAGISIGASYRLDVWFIHHTFTLELSAYMHLWGPEFSGLVRIKWVIFSFTIHFNSGSDARPPKLSFQEFTEGFLPEFSGGMDGAAASGYQMARLRAADGYLGKKQGRFPDRNAVHPVHYMTVKNFQVEVESQFPCRNIEINPGAGLQNGARTESCPQSVGILPMQMENLDVRLILRVERLEEQGESEAYRKIPVAMDGRVICKHMPRAIWDVKKPDMNAPMLQDLYCGYALTGGEREGHSLPTDGPSGGKRWYSLKTLQQNEEYHCPQHYRWNSFIANGQMADERKRREWNTASMVETMKKNQKRNEWLSQLGDYHVRSAYEVDVEHFASHIEQLVAAPPVVRSVAQRPESV